MNIYSINIVAPILRYSDKLVAYNEYPIVCVTKKSTEELLVTNKNLQDAIIKTIESIGIELLDDIMINVRSVSMDRKVLNSTLPVKKYYEKWIQCSQRS